MSVSPTRSVPTSLARRARIVRTRSFRTVAALVFLVCVALLGVPEPVCAADQPPWLKKDTLDRLFPQVAAYTGQMSGEPPAMPVYSAGRPIGFVFSTADMTDVIG